MDQKVLCIKAETLFEGGKWEGLKSDNLDELYQLLLDSSEFRVRSELEDDPSYKQVIPQVILKHKDKYFLHRQVNANEARLNSLCPLFLSGIFDASFLRGIFLP